MRFCIKPHEDGWVLSPMEGKFSNEDVATAEGLTVEDVSLGEGGKMYGNIKAAWGVTIFNDHVTLDIDMLRALGIGRTFKAKAKKPFRFSDDFFACNETNKKLIKAKHVLLYHSGMFYAD